MYCSISLGVAMYQSSVLFVALRMYVKRYFARKKVLSYSECDQVISVDADDLKKTLSIGAQTTERCEMTNKIIDDIIKTTRKEIRQSEARQHKKMSTMFKLLKTGSSKISH